MQIIDLVKVHEPCLLHHPVVGWVTWSPGIPGSDYLALHWAIGPEAGRTLEADECVLFDNQWEASTFEALEAFCGEHGLDPYKRPEWANANT